MAARLTTIAAAPIRVFAEKHRLKVVTDKGDGTQVIPGKKGQVSEYDSRHLAVMCISEDCNWTARGWNSARRAGEAAGMPTLMDGDAEGSLSFDPDNPGQARLAIKLAACKTRKQRSEKQIAQLQDARTKNPLAKRGFTSSEALKKRPLAA
jgi:hypothetical protein